MPNDTNSIVAALRGILPGRLRRAVAVLRHSDDAEVMFHPRYADDGLVTRHVPTFLADPQFTRAYAAGKETGALDGLGFDIEWRAHVACFAASHALRLDGDFVECGVGRGLLSRTLTTYTDFRQSSKTLYLVDTFEGLVAELLLEQEKNRHEMDRMESLYQDNFRRVTQTFADVPNVRIIKGRVPDALNQVAAERVAYLSIDMNNVTPEIAAAEFFWDKLVPFGMILLDDFAYGEEFAAQTNAFIEFAARKGTKILTLPTGQGLIIK